MEHGLRSWSVTNAILLLGAAFLLSYVLRLLYNVYLHPLAKFPGPKLAAASRWYDFYFDVLKAPGGQYMYEINRMHEQYGVWRYGSTSKRALMGMQVRLCASVLTRCISTTRIFARCCMPLGRSAIR